MGIVELKNLRSQTGAGILDCKKALQESNQDFKKALTWIKTKGLARAEKKSLRVAKEGRVASYIHGEGRIGVLVEVNVETDFAARSDHFKTFTHQLCLHIAAMNPLYIKREDVPVSLQKEEEAIFQEQVKKIPKKPEINKKIVDGKMNKWFSEICLTEQILLSSSQSDDVKTIEASLKELISRLGENIIINRFVRFELGEENLKTLVGK